MVKIKNTNNNDVKIIINGAEIVLNARCIMEVNNVSLNSLPNGVVVTNGGSETELLVEIDPYMNSDNENKCELLVENI